LSKKVSFLDFSSGGQIDIFGLINELRQIHTEFPRTAYNKLRRRFREISGSKKAQISTSYKGSEGGEGLERSTEARKHKFQQAIKGLRVISFILLGNGSSHSLDMLHKQRFRSFYIDSMNAYLSTEFFSSLQHHIDF
jgi:hypothetical protein